jgi:hypothetical protein
MITTSIDLRLSRSCCSISSIIHALNNWKVEVVIVVYVVNRRKSIRRSYSWRNWIELLTSFDSSSDSFHVLFRWVEPIPTSEPGSNRIVSSLSNISSISFELLQTINHVIQHLVWILGYMFWSWRLYDRCLSTPLSFNWIVKCVMKHIWVVIWALRRCLFIVVLCIHWHYYWIFAWRRFLENWELTLLSPLEECNCLRHASWSYQLNWNKDIFWNKEMKFTWVSWNL